MTQNQGTRDVLTTVRLGFKSCRQSTFDFKILMS